MRRLAGDRKAETSEIDLTPMLDVVFILLIFFVVTATFLSESAIDAASNENNQEDQPPPDPDKQNILVELGPNNDIIINGGPRPIVEAQLRANIDRLKAENPQASVIIRPHIRSNVQTLVLVMDSARQAGIYNISIIEP
jgi:biopolymer transport protein ExbD